MVYPTTEFFYPLGAIKAFENRCPDLLLTDVMMPKLNGIDLSIQITTMCPNRTVLLLSGQANTEDLLKEAGSRGYEFEILPKPIHPAELLAKARSKLENSV